MGAIDMVMGISIIDIIMIILIINIMIISIVSIVINGTVIVSIIIIITSIGSRISSGSFLLFVVPSGLTMTAAGGARSLKDNDSKLASHYVRHPEPQAPNPITLETLRLILDTQLM